MRFQTHSQTVMLRTPDQGFVTHCYNDRTAEGDAQRERERESAHDSFNKLQHCPVPILHVTSRQGLGEKINKSRKLLQVQYLMCQLNYYSLHCRLVTCSKNWTLLALETLMRSDWALDVRIERVLKSDCAGILIHPIPVTGIFWIRSLKRSSTPQTKSFFFIEFVTF